MFKKKERLERGWSEKDIRQLLKCKLSSHGAYLNMKSTVQLCAYYCCLS